MTTHTTLDRSAGIAVWRQIMETLKAEIVSGAFEKGSRLPPESELAARFGVNRHTVRRAIAADPVQIGAKIVGDMTGVIGRPDGDDGVQHLGIVVF